MWYFWTCFWRLIIFVQKIVKLHIFLRKTPQKIAPTKAALLTQICTKWFVDWGFASDPTGGAYSAPPDPLVVFRGPTSKEGRGGEGRGRAEEGKGKWREGRGDREGPEREEEGKEGEGLPWLLGVGPQCLNPALLRPVIVRTISNLLGTCQKQNFVLNW